MMTVSIADKVAPTFRRPWDVTAVCLDRPWLDTLALAFSQGNTGYATNPNVLSTATGNHGTLQLTVTADGSIVDKTAGSGHANLYNYIQTYILSKTNSETANAAIHVPGVSGKNNVPNNVFTRVTGTDCSGFDMDVRVRRTSWNCDAGVYELVYRPTKNGIIYDGPGSWLSQNVFAAVSPTTGAPVTGQSNLGGNVTKIFVQPVHQYQLRFPADVTTTCGSVGTAESAIANVVDGGEDACDVLAVLVQDKKYNGATANGVPVAECFRIFRTFTVVNWCQYDVACAEPMDNAYIVPRSISSTTGRGVAVTVTVRDANRDRTEEFTVSSSTVTPSATAGAGDQTGCNGSSANRWLNNGSEVFAWMYTQHIFVNDNTVPTVTEVTAAPYKFDKSACTSSVDITIRASDNCANLLGNLSGTEIDSTSLSIERLVLVPDANPALSGHQPGTPVNVNGSGLGALNPVRRLNQNDKGTNSWVYEARNLPDGTHQLRVVVRDDCGNLSTQFIRDFTVGDNVGTAPICINGLSTNLMPDVTGGNRSATLWASDFVASDVYDCNGQDAAATDPANSNLKRITTYAVYKDEAPTQSGFQNGAIGADGLPTAASGWPTAVTINCADLQNVAPNPIAGTKALLVRLYTRDARGNWAWCETFVSVDNASACPANGSTSASIAGAITTESNLNVEGVEVNLSGNATMTYTTNTQGQFSFAGLAKGYDYTVTPQLDKNYLNGVSTFDLVLITKHILGVQPLNSAYKLIAADVNNSKSVTTLDLIQLRKLVLNIDTKFANNTSWRFVDASFRFANAANPWATQFPEVANLNDLAVDARANFIAIKVGDVNGNAVASASARTAGTFNLNIDDQQMKAGNEYRVAIAGDLSSIEGMQFTMNYNNKVVELVNIEYGVAKEEHFGIFAKEGVITASWNGNASNGVIATLVFRASADANLSEVLNLNSRYTAAEAYGRGGEQLGVALNFAGAQSKVAGFELKQNTPNPFAGETVIGFNLPVSGEATLTIQDVTGRTLRVVRGQYAEGYNQVTIKSADLGATGVLYYTLEASNFVATKKMIIVE